MRTDTEETGALLTAGTGGAVHFAVETGTSFESIGLSEVASSSIEQLGALTGFTEAEVEEGGPQARTHFLAMWPG